METGPKAPWPDRYLIFALLYMAAIFGASSIPDTSSFRGQTILFLPPQYQNLLHIPAYLIMGLLWIQALRGGVPRLTPRVFWAMLICLGYGVLDEVHQYFVPGRYFSVTDVVFDGLGASLAGAIVWLRTRN